MRKSRLLLQLAALTAMGSLVLTLGAMLPAVDRALRGGGAYPEYYCAMTPMNWIPSRCGCPVPAIKQDFCSGSLPPKASDNN
jgi:hypothetical protein